VSERKVEVNYSYESVPTLLRFADSDKFIRGITGPFGSGKSSACVMEVFQRGIAQRVGVDGVSRTRWLVVRNTYRQLIDTTIRTFFDWFMPKHWGRYRVSEHDYRITAVPNVEIDILFRGLDRPDHVGNLLSLEATGAWLNEAREIPQEIFEAIQGRVGRYPSKRNGGCTWSGIFMDTNPPDADSWWYKLFEEVRPENAEIFKQPSGLGEGAENLVHLPDDYYRNLAIGKDPEFVKVYVHGEYGFIVDGKPVYPEYKDHVHCREIGPLKGVPIRRGWDFGLTPACSFTQMGPTGQWLLIDELTADNTGIDRFSDKVLRYCAKEYGGFVFQDFGDPAGDQRAQTDEKTCFQVLRAKNVWIEPGEQDVYIRVESVKKALNTMIEGEPGLLISPKCKMLRKGFRGGYKYRRMQTANRQFTERPDKNEYSHCFSAGTMVSTPTGPVPIEHMVEGDWVSTPMGPRRVSGRMENTSETIRIMFDDGREIVCTPDHPFLGNDGLVRADALQYAVTETAKVTASWVDLQNIRYSISKASRTTGSLPGITSLITIGMVVGISTVWFGRRIMARFLNASTIKTMISRITTYLIWNAPLYQTMPHITRISDSQMATPLYCGALRQRSRRPESGMGQRLESNGTVSMESACGKTGSRKERSAPFVEMNTTRFSTGKGTAARSANHGPGATRALTIIRGRVLSVAQRLWSTDTRKQKLVQSHVLKVSARKPCGRMTVYDLTVDDAHCFYANGVLVHNCHDALQYDATRLFGMMLKTPKQQKEDRYNRRTRYTSWMAA